MTKKKMTFLAVTAVVVIGISGGAVYAYIYQQEQTRQEQEKIEQGKKLQKRRSGSGCQQGAGSQV
ncbi:hypothetical protein K040078D81_45000 [Blautia hominis]|uniref:Uncharacterized protein n=1 Tax=Blautia hominis TaxID=2025493 RepID=A0ABQ0BG07_9FIRM